MEDEAEVQEMGALSKKRDEAAELEDQADELEGLIDFSRPMPARFPNLKPSTSRVTMRLPSWLLDEIKREANRRDVPYQSLMKVVLVEWLKTQSAA